MTRRDVVIALALIVAAAVGAVRAETPSDSHVKLIGIRDALEKEAGGLTDEEATVLAQDVTYHLSSLAGSTATYCGVLEKVIGARIALQIGGLFVHRCGMPSQAKVICAPVKAIYESLGTPSGNAMAWAVDRQADALNAMFDGIRLDRDEGWGSGLTAELPDDIAGGSTGGSGGPDIAPPPDEVTPTPPPTTLDPPPPTDVPPPTEPPPPLPTDVVGGGTGDE